MPLRVDLPQMCPPGQSTIQFPCQVIRLIKEQHAQADDFLDWVDEPWNSNRSTTINECQQKSMSVFEPGGSKLKSVIKIPRVRQRYKYYAVIDIDAAAGTLIRTGSPDHISWWKCNLWNPIPKIALVDEVANV